MSSALPPATILYLLVRSDLKMSKGKIVAQAVHAVSGVFFAACDQPTSDFIHHTKNRTVITLKVSGEAEMDTLLIRAKALGIPTYVQADAGLTQVAPDTRTVSAIGPVVDSAPVRELFKHLKLL